MRPVLLDTSAIVASLDRAETYHGAVADAVRQVEAPLVTCESVISESCYLLRHIRGAAEAVVDNVVEGIFQIPFQIAPEAAAIKQILRKYRDQGIDFADACLVRLAEEFGTPDVLTLDRDFQIYRWGRNKPFHLLIDLH